MKAPDRNEEYYFKFTLLAVAYFFLMHLVLHLIAMRYAQVYRDMNSVKRAEYRTYITSPIHAIVAVYLSATAMWWICEDGKTVFNDD